MGFGGSAMMQGVMNVFVRRCPTDPLRQQRAGDHAEHADGETDQLRWHRIFGTHQQFDQQPRGDAADCCEERPLGGRT